MEKYNFKKIYESLKENRPELIEALSKIKLICLDFDGTFTDNTTTHGIKKEGEEVYEVETITRSKIDSMAIDLLKDSGSYNKSDYESTNHEIDLIFLSKETSPVIKINAAKVKIKCTNSLENKIGAMNEEIKKRYLQASEILFIGNDYNDLECIKQAGIGVAVKDSVKDVKDVADYVTWHKGGKGAFREIIELILYAKEKHPLNKI